MKFDGNEWLQNVLLQSRQNRSHDYECYMPIKVTNKTITEKGN